MNSPIFIVKVWLRTVYMNQQNLIRVNLQLISAQIPQYQIPTKIPTPNMDRSNQKNQRECTTPQRMKMIESIKKSIHRSIQKINPAQYKNILKGQYIFMHLIHKGEIINSEYTKVALFMGAIVLKKAVEKISAVVTNQAGNKIVKKLALMGKPILSVLWLQACFQEKRKVPYEDFLFQEGKDQANQQQNLQENLVILDPLVELYKTNLADITKRFQTKYPTKFLHFIDKKQKIDRNKGTFIPPHQIDIGAYQPQKRKSQVITERGNKKKNQKRKVQIKSEGNPKSNQNKLSTVISLREQDKNQDEDFGNKVRIDELKDNFVENKEKNSKNIYEKYLKDFKKYQNKIKTTNIEQIPLKIQQEDTPCFSGNVGQDHNYKPSHYNHNINKQTPTKSQNPRKFYDEQLLKTYSIKKQPSKNIRLNIIHPMISQKIQKINVERQRENLPLLEIAGNDTRNMICVISQQSKVEAILALLSKPKIIVNQNFITAIENEPLLEITENFMKKYEVLCKLNITNIQGKKIVLLDSVMGNSSLTNIINKCNAVVLGVGQFLFNKNTIDYVITNKKMYMRSDKDTYRVLSQANFINELVQFEKKTK